MCIALRGGKVGIMRALPLYVYKTPKLGDCSNGGVSAKYDEILLLCNEGNVEIDPDNLPENLCKIVTRTIGGRPVYSYVEPVKPKDSGCVGWMAGGCYVGTSDGRFHRLSQYPLSLHDRQETSEQYEMMNN